MHAKMVNVWNSFRDAQKLTANIEKKRESEKSSCSTQRAPAERKRVKKSVKEREVGRFLKLEWEKYRNIEWKKSVVCSIENVDDW